MDLIDKINQLQKYNSAPFSEYYDDSLFFTRTLNIIIDKIYPRFTLETSTINRSMLENVSYSFTITIENVNNISLFLNEIKKNIIVKTSDRYILFKNVSSVYINNANSRAYNNFFNISNNYSETLDTNNGNIKVIGYAQEVQICKLKE